MGAGSVIAEVEAAVEAGVRTVNLKRRMIAKEELDADKDMDGH